jgi:hypothetical protein
MSLHLCGAILVGRLRDEGPSRDLKLASTSGALVLFGRNSVGQTVYKLFENWGEAESYLKEKSLSLSPLTEVSQIPPAYIHVEAIDPATSLDGEHKVLWSQTGNDRYVIHTPDPRTAEVLRSYVYFHGLERSHLGFSIPVSHGTP